MNKVTLLISAFIISLGVVGGVASTPAQAQEAACNSIVISNTGAGSNNEGTCIIDVSVNAVCENNIYILNDNSQDAVSGAASTIGTVNGNTTVSGNATNENNASVELGASCGEAATETPVTPTPDTGTDTPTTPTPGMGNSTPKQSIAALPNTAANSTVVIIAAVAATIAAAFAASRLAMYAYRRANEK